MARRLPITATRLLASLLALFLLAIPARLVAAETCSYDGGWALRSDAKSCPPAAPITCGVGYQPRCCPTGLVCAGDGDYGGNYCCVKGQDCRTKASEEPKCPDSSWTLWGVDGELDSGGWCCMAGKNGTYVTRSGSVSVGCLEPDGADLDENQAWADPVSTVSCSTSASATSAAATSAMPSPPTTATGSATGSPVSGTPEKSAAAAAAADKAGQTTGSPGTGAASEDGDEDGSLAPGAIAGIVVGVVLGLALLVAAGLFLCRRRKRRAAERAAGAERYSTWSADQYAAGPPPPIQEIGGHETMGEMPGSEGKPPVYEMGVSDRGQK